MEKQAKIILILPYFGKWPIWLEAFMISVEKNPTIHWLMPTDCEIPDQYPNNIKFVSTTLKELNSVIDRKLGFQIPLSPKKLCDLKPAYGHVFEDDIKEYDFWGFTDLDIIYGNIRKFITAEMLENYDMISSRKNALSGHFTLVRNNPEMNFLYQQIPNYKVLYQAPQMVCFDELHFYTYCKEIKNSFRLFNSEYLLNNEHGKDSYQEYVLNKCFWENGEVFCQNQEIMYLHFMNWKNLMTFSEVKYNNKPKSFYISYKGFHLKRFPVFVELFSNTKNYFFGFYFSRKVKKVKKAIKKRLNIKSE